MLERLKGTDARLELLATLPRGTHGHMALETALKGGPRAMSALWELAGTGEFGVRGWKVPKKGVNNRTFAW
jgi:hypothetical protein